MLPASTAGGMGLIHAWGTKILHPICHVAWLEKKKKKRERWIGLGVTKFRGID